MSDMSYQADIVGALFTSALKPGSLQIKESLGYKLLLRPHSRLWDPKVISSKSQCVFLGSHLKNKSLLC